MNGGDASHARVGFALSRGKACASDRAVIRLGFTSSASRAIIDTTTIPGFRVGLHRPGRLQDAARTPALNPGEGACMLIAESRGEDLANEGGRRA